MPDNRIDIVLQARDNASAQLAAYRKSVQDAEEATRKAAKANEELSRTSASAATGIGTLGLAVGAATLAAELAGAAFRKYVEQIREGAERQAMLNIAVRSFDTSKIVSELKKVELEMETQRKLQESWVGTFINGWQAMLEGLGLATPLWERNKDAVQALGAALPIEAMIRFSKLLQEVNVAQQAGAQLDAQRSIRLGQIQAYTAAQNALVEAIKREGDEERNQIQKRAQREVEQLPDAARDIEGPRIEAARDMEIGLSRQREQIRIRGAQQATDFGREQLRLRESLYARNQAATVGDLATGDEGGIFFGPAAQNSVRQLLQEIESKAVERLLVLIRNEREVLGENAVSDYAETPFSPKAEAETKQLANQLDQQALELEARKAEIAAQSAGLSQAEVARLQLISVEMRLQAQLQDDNLTKSQKALALFEAQAVQQGILRREAERTQAIPGLDRGLKDMVEDFGAIGLRMQSLAHSAAQGMSAAFSDGFFNVITGNFKALPDVAKQMTNSMVRAITDELGKLVTAPILQNLRGLLSGGMRSFLPVSLSTGLAFGPAVEGAGSGGGPAGTVVTPSGQYFSAQDVGTAYRAAGDAGVRALQQGRATVAGDRYLADISPEFTQTSYVLPQTSPSLFQRSLAVGGNAAALGLSAYAATQNTSPAGTFVSAGLGALSGAGLGASVAQSFPALGLSTSTGALGGAAVGAAITGTLAYMAQQQAAKEAARARQVAELQRAAGAGGDLVQAAGTARNLPEFYDIIRQFGSGTTGGTTPVAVPVSVTPAGGGAPRAIGTANPTYPVADLADIIENPDTLTAGIQAGVDPSALAGPNAATSQGLRAIAKNLIEQYQQQAQGVGVSDQELIPTPDGGVRRRTEVPATLASRFQGQNFDIENAGLFGLDDPTIATIYSQLVRYDADQGMNRLVRDENDLIVSVTRATAPVLPPTAPVQTTPPPVIPTTPAPTTGELLTAGGATALALGAQLADPNSLLNAILPQGWTGADLAAKISQLFSSGSISGPAPGSSLALGDLEAQGRGLFDSLDDIGAAAGSEFGYSQGLAVLQGAGALYGLFQGAQTGDPISIAQSVLGIYSAISTLTSNAVPGITTLLAQGVGVLTGVGAEAGAQIASTALAAAGPYLAAAAPLIQGLIQWAISKDEMKDLRSWAVIGQVASRLQSQAQTQITQANALFAALRAQGVTDPTVIKNALALGSAALAAYYRKVQGPGGPIGISDFYAHTGQNPAPIQQAAAQLQQYMKDATAFLIQGGATPESLGSLAPSTWGELYGGQGYGANLQAAPKTLPGQPGGQWVSQGQGTVWVEDGTTTAPTDVTQNVNQGIALNTSQGRTQAPDAVNQQFGGAFWTMWNYLLGSNERPDPGEAIGTPVITGAQAWLPGGATPGAVSGPDAVENPLAQWELLMLLALAGWAQGAFTSGGGTGDTGQGDAPAGSDGPSGPSGPGGGAGP
ncbi:MAG TPA: hypothetical protein VKA83_09405 [Methylomirabilota bacterium]|nr:hypothetical protein [Methylomirabilota bacterium]